MKMLMGMMIVVVVVVAVAAARGNAVSKRSDTNHELPQKVCHGAIYGGSMKRLMKSARNITPTLHCLIGEHKGVADGPKMRT